MDGIHDPWGTRSLEPRSPRKPSRRADRCPAVLRPCLLPGPSGIVGTSDIDTFSAVRSEVDGPGGSGIGCPVPMSPLDLSLGRVVVHGPCGRNIPDPNDAIVSALGSDTRRWVIIGAEVRPGRIGLFSDDDFDHLSRRSPATIW